MSDLWLFIALCLVFLVAALSLWQGVQRPPSRPDLSLGRLPDPEARAQLLDDLHSLRLEVRELESGYQLLRQEWRDQFEKMRKSEERTRKHAARVAQEEDPETIDDIHQLRALLNGDSSQLELEPPRPRRRVGRTYGQIHNPRERE